jgi:hypothetical protein
MTIGIADSILFWRKTIRLSGTARVIDLCVLQQLMQLQNQAIFSFKRSVNPQPNHLISYCWFLKLSLLCFFTRVPRTGEHMLQLLDLKYDRSQQLLSQSRKETAGQFAIATCADHPELFDACVALENETWDELSFLDYTQAHHAHYENLLENFPEYHLCMIELGSGEMVATGMCVPLRVANPAALPREGWDWVVETAAEQNGKGANTIGALSISVPQQHRHRGFARDMINTMRSLAVINKFSGVIAPVRPSSKCRHPLVPMQQYVEWRDERGRIFDPWLRSHVAAGGQVMGVCDRSMVVEQPLEFWQSWTCSKLDKDGPAALPGGLVPLEIDVGSSVGRYVEPNVWVAHRL